MKRVVCSVLVLLSASASAHHNSTLDFRMLNTASDPFKYWIDARVATPQGLPLTQVRDAIQHAFQSWQDVACAYTAFSYQGLSTANAQIVQPADSQDAFNVAGIWVNSTADSYYQLALGGGAAVGASIALSYAGVLQQCDIYLNGVDFAWSAAVGSSGMVDVESVVLHEAGHCQGLDHTLDPKDVMYVSISPGIQKRQLSVHDSQDLCRVAPQSGAIGSPCTADGGCPGDPALRCVRPPLADGGTSNPLCTKGCATTGVDSCPLPFMCRASNLIAGSPGACLPGLDDVTFVGKPCVFPLDCGSVDSTCHQKNDPMPLPSGFDNWPGGYCTQPCGAGKPACPPGSSCFDGQCLKRCRFGTGDCRPGYSCGLLSDTGPAVCIPSCHADIDCGGSTFACRVCDGLCMRRQNPLGQIGNPCMNASECGMAQVCLSFPNISHGLCSQPCGTTCAACPAGSSCHLIGQNGERYCLRDCGEGTCPSGLQCAPLAEGKGCMPPCASDLECPVGNVCLAGQCKNPFTASDAGCVLCPKDGGTGGSPSGPGPSSGGSQAGGCGCSSAGGTAWAALGMLMALFGAGALRRRERRPVTCRFKNQR